MPTMAETLIALPSQDDALARRLLQRAQGAFQKWPEGFAGFRAQIQCWTSGQNASGWLQVSPGQRIEVHLPNAELRSLAQIMLARLVDERMPRFFKDGDGRYPITLDAEHGHPFGKRIQVHRRDGERLAYWIDTTGRIRYREREVEGQRMVTAFEEYSRATPGRVLPTRVTMAWFDIESGACIRSETIVDTHCRMNYVSLPATQQVTITGINAIQTVLLTLDAHTLLCAC
jgi:Protein of unknown function (DUF3386)